MSNPASNINSDSMRLSQAFKDFYKIPKHQREFSWEAEEQITRLWEDVKTAKIYDESNPGSELGHFLGPIVVIGKSTCDYDKPQEVIDGQQRLTSLTILARVMLDRVDTEITTTSQRQSTQSGLLGMLYEHIGSTSQARVRLNRDNEFYYKSVVASATQVEREDYWETTGVNNPNTKLSAVKYRIVRAFRLLDRLIDEELDSFGPTGTSARSEAFSQYCETLRNSFYVLKVVVPNTLMAYRLFETLNERGLDLSQADLVKNVLLEQGLSNGGSTEHDKISALWDEMLDDFDRQDPQKLTKIPDLIQYSFSSRHKSIKSESLFDEISGTVQLGGTGQTALDLAKQFRNDASYWNSFLEIPTKWSPEAKLSAALIVSHLWKQHSTPVLLRVYERFHDLTPPVELETCLRGIENFLFREGIINKASVAALERVLSEAARVINDKSKTSRDLLEILNDASDDKPFVDNFALASAKTNKLGFYVMWRIEKHLITGGLSVTGLSPEIQGVEKNHLEHILPRNPSSAWGGIENDPDFSNYINRFGNLLILDSKHNLALSNSSFDDKLEFPPDPPKSYKNQKFETVKEVVSNTSWLSGGTWAFQSIEKRQRHLADKYALDIWSLT